ncbi:MAG: FHA domain-containing protein, partial [Planctomycetes bacterium]|nr:FHA domain-containing protein [Planctomycetota bacterium]
MPTKEDLAFARRAEQQRLAPRRQVEECLAAVADLEKRGTPKSLEEVMKERGVLRERLDLDLPGSDERTVIAPATSEPGPADAAARKAQEDALIADFVKGARGFKIPDAGQATVMGPSAKSEAPSAKEVDEEILMQIEEEGKPEAPAPAKPPAPEAAEVAELELVEDEEPKIAGLEEAAPEPPAAEAVPPEPSAAKEEPPPTVAMPRASVPAEAKPAAEEEPVIGKVIGGFKIVSKLGQGGMGAVYKAEDLTLKRLIALKLLPESLVGDNDKLKSRFFREAQAAGQLQHENIVQVYAMGEDEDHYYIAMQYVEGPSLQEVIRKNKPMSIPQCIKVTQDVAKGMLAAEERQIVHRDLKPSNILLTPDGMAKVADFGLAKNLGVDSNLTYSGQVLGTPHFMSPEQCEGRPVDARTDIYALGATLYYLVTRRFPFVGETALSVMLKHKTEPIVPPEEYVASLPSGVSAAIRKMMAKQVQDRYASFREVLKDLDLLAQGKPPAIAKELPGEKDAHRAARMRALLSVVKGKNKGEMFTVGEGMVVSIGRDSTRSNLAILDPMISRIHCVVRNEGRRFTLADFGSVNGTFVNGNRIQTHVLQANDRVRLGSTEIAFRLLPASNDAIQLAKLSVDQGLISNDQAAECLATLAEAEMSGSQRGMGDIMLEKGCLTADQVARMREKLDSRIKVLILKERVPVPVAAPVAAPTPTPETPKAAKAEPSGKPAATPPPGKRSALVRVGLFEGLMFCDKCGEYISDEDISAGRVRRIDNSLFCPQCLKDNPMLGQKLQNYILWERLGAGRLGVTHKAEHLASQRIMVVKLLKEDLCANAEFMGRLSEAVKLASTLSHPSVVRVFGLEIAGDSHLLTMEYVGERSVRDLLVRKTPEG